ncbi:uncharacterized protein LOC124594223 [Schistocerca americana]|uniref:uncharacterized protein LOC124594223 n=1 Tax=Schistocerca americana TaxID=7009 RepID=UPI001F502F7A|nr:uncharacterized protein LOC124594223 [Schistocerca americana]
MDDIAEGKALSRPRLLQLPFLLLLLAPAAGEELSAEEAVRLAQRWSPVVRLSQQERFLPSSAEAFLGRMRAWHPGLGPLPEDQLPQGAASRGFYLLPRDSLLNASELTSGTEPWRQPVPVYVVGRRCGRAPAQLQLQVSVWLFFPWSQGKRLCAAGGLPLPLPAPLCPHALTQVFGSHLGDWEHLAFLFPNASSAPRLLQLWTHHRSAVYGWDSARGAFSLLEPAAGFPATVAATADGRPILYAADGSHGLWAKPGRHVFAPALGLWDECSAGGEWRTWERVSALGAAPWRRYLGRWGPPASVQFAEPNEDLLIEESKQPSSSTHLTNLDITHHSHNELPPIS